MEFPVAENGFAEEYGNILSLVSPCCVMFYTMMMFQCGVIPHFRHSLIFVLLNLHIQDQNKSVVIFTLFSTLSLCVSISYD